MSNHQEDMHLQADNNQWCRGWPFFMFFYLLRSSLILWHVYRSVARNVTSQDHNFWRCSLLALQVTMSCDVVIMRHHKKHVNRHVDPFLAYHFRLILCLILLYIFTFIWFQQLSFLSSRNWAVSYSLISLKFLHYLYTYIQLLLCCTIAICLPSSHLYQNIT